MNLQQLEYALAVASYRNFGKAAKAFGVSQPAISMQISKLEKELGITIFDRSNHKITLSSEGVMFLDKAKHLISESHRLAKFAEDLKSNFTGDIRIGIIPTLAPYLIPLVIDNVQKYLGNARIQIYEYLTEEIIQALQHGDIDLGIVATPVSASVTLRFIPLFYEKFMLFVSENHPLSMQDFIDIDHLPTDDILLLKEGNCFRNQVRNICGLKNNQLKKSQFTFESNSIESLCRIVEYVNGITFLPELTTIQFDSEREHLIKKLKRDDFSREISIIYLPGSAKKDLIKKVKEAIQESLPQHMLFPPEQSPVDPGVMVDLNG